MAHHKVKRITVEPDAHSEDKWDDSWLNSAVEQVRKGIEYARRRVFASSKFAYWCGLSGIIGGILWGLMFLIFQLIGLGLELGWYSLAVWFGSWVSTILLVVPMLLFILCLIGLYTEQEKQRLGNARLRRIGFTLATLGLISAIWSTIDEYWLARWVGESSPGFIHYIYSGWLFDWGRVASSALMVMGIGLVLFGVAIIRARVLPTWVAVWFVVTSLAIFLVPLGLRLFITGYEMYELLYGGGVFVGTMLLFATSWVSLGIALLRSHASSYVDVITLAQEPRVRHK